MWCWRRLLDCKEILKEISPKYSLEGLILKYWNSNTLATWWEELTHWKRPWCWERLKTGEEDEMVGWHHQLNGLEFEQAPGLGDGQGSLAWCSPWGHKSDRTERLNWTNRIFLGLHYQRCMPNGKKEFVRKMSILRGHIGSGQRKTSREKPWERPTIGQEMLHTERQGLEHSQ